MEHNRYAELTNALGAKITYKIINKSPDFGGYSRSLLVVSPNNRAEVIDAVSLASRFQIGINPISTGLNFGYGELVPWKEGSIVLDLSNLNSILEFDDSSGEVRIEPGLTQQMLYEFLSDKNFLADSTGAGPNASVLGNALDGGFGYSPYGARRYSIVDLEILMANGEIIKTGDRFDCGPTLSSLFIQSNFGVVLSAKLRLFKKPEIIKGLVIQIESDDNLPKVLGVMQQLHYEGVVKNIVHFANAMRVFLSSEDLTKFSLASTDFITDEFICKNSPFPFSSKTWTGLGAVMGDSRCIRSYEKIIKAELNGLAKVRVISRSSLQVIAKLGKLLPGYVNQKFNDLDEFIALQEGKPTELAWRNIRGKFSSLEDLGLIWIGINAPPNGLKILAFYQNLKRLFESSGFECPVTISMVEPQSAMLISNISFNKNCAEHTLRAHKLYSEVSLLVKNCNFSFYRASSANFGTLYPDDKRNLLQRLKLALDPDNIIAPGRYGIG